MNEIFLSYRRADEKGTTGRLFDHLVQAFGRESIFYDVDKIPRGVDFREFIDQTIRKCRVVLVVIGPRWLDISDAGGRRLDQLNDPVRIEVETAIRWRKPVIPVLIDDAKTPKAASLPATMTALAVQNAAPMHNNQYFEQDINTLINDIARLGVTRKVQGFIQNPPSAGFLTRRQTAAIIGVPLVLVVIGLLAALGIGYVAYTLITNGMNSLNGLTQGYATNGAHGTLTSFCTAMAHNDYTTAYSYLTPAFQAKIGSAQNLATNLTTDFAGRQVTVTGCHPFATGSSDLSYVETGNTATDEVVFTATTATGDSTTVGNKTMQFVKVGNTWEIDGVVNG